MISSSKIYKYQILFIPFVKANMALSAWILFYVSSYSYRSISISRSRVVVVVRIEELAIDWPSDRLDIWSPTCWNDVLRLLMAAWLNWLAVCWETCDLIDTLLIFDILLAYDFKSSNFSSSAIFLEIYEPYLEIFEAWDAALDYLEIYDGAPLLGADLYDPISIMSSALCYESGPLGMLAFLYFMNNSNSRFFSSSISLISLIASTSVFSSCLQRRTHYISL